jgi:hypothetical protein
LGTWQTRYRIHGVEQQTCRAKSGTRRDNTSDGTWHMQYLQVSKEIFTPRIVQTRCFTIIDELLQPLLLEQRPQVCQHIPSTLADVLFSLSASSREKLKKLS